MYPHTAALIQHLREQHGRLRAALDAVPLERRRRRPAPERWSAAEVVEHLAIIEGRLVAMLQKAPVAGASPESPQIDGDVRRVLDRSVRVAAPEAAVPSGTVDAEEAWRQLDAARTQLERELIARDEVDLSHITREHPFLGVLNLYQWVWFTGGHEARHAAQISELSDHA